MTASAVQRQSRAVYRILASNVSLKHAVCVSYAVHTPASDHPVNAYVSLVCQGPGRKHHYILLRQRSANTDVYVAHTAQAAKESARLFEKFDMKPSDCTEKSAEQTVLVAEHEEVASGWNNRSYVLCSSVFKDLVVKEVRLNLEVCGGNVGGEYQSFDVHLGEFKMHRVTVMHWNASGLCCLNGPKRRPC